MALDVSRLLLQAVLHIWVVVGDLWRTIFMDNNQRYRRVLYAWRLQVFPLETYSYGAGRQL